MDSIALKEGMKDRKNTENDEWACDEMRRDESTFGRITVYHTTLPLFYLIMYPIYLRGYHLFG